MDWKRGDFAIIDSTNAFWYVPENLVDNSDEINIYRKVTSLSSSKRIHKELVGYLCEVVDPTQMVIYVPAEHLYTVLWFGHLKKIT